jgi:cytochrome c biogenesis protein CcmG/thiol:disulfide interchange protein DsbE
VRFLTLVLVAACTHAVAPPPPKPAPPPAPPVAVAAVADPDAPSWIGVRFDRKTTRVIQVVPNGPAEKAGVKIGDEVIAIDGHAVFIDMEAVQTIRGHAPAATPFVVRRDGKEVPITIHIAQMPDVDELSKQTLLGKPAPEFAAQPIAGAYSPVLKDLKGHVVVVDFWATWCGPCGVTIPYLDQWQTTYGPRGLRIIGLTSEEEPAVKQFLAANPLSYAIARDVDDRIGQVYLRFAVPMLVVIDRAGVVRHVQVGTDGFESVEAAIMKLL